VSDRGCADVISVVGVGAVKVRAKPDHVDTEPLQVVELGGEAVEVADAVAVAIVELSAGRPGIRLPPSTRRLGER
jgi:hypothetical protein